MSSGPWTGPSGRAKKRRRIDLQNGTSSRPTKAIHTNTSKSVFQILLKMALFLFQIGSHHGHLLEKTRCGFWKGALILYQFLRKMLYSCKTRRNTGGFYLALSLFRLCLRGWTFAIVQDQRVLTSTDFSQHCQSCSSLSWICHCTLKTHKMSSRL